MAPGLHPQTWASRVPFGIGQQKPNNYLEIVKAVRENSDNLPYAWRILTQGTCDGCALGTKGIRDWTLDEVHLCNIRLRLLRLNTMPAFAPGLPADVAPLRRRTARELRELGRLAHPYLRRSGEPGFTRVGWDEALALAAGRIRATTPDRLGFYLTSRGMPNESYYVAGKAARAMGTNSVDNAARVCHSPSTYGLREALGVGATTCSYTDWIGTDLIVFAGSNVANNQPVAMKYLDKAKKAGTTVVCVNPYREPGMERYWVPSNVESAVFGTRITDRFFQISVGGDTAFLSGALKHMDERGLLDRSFVDSHTSGYEALAGDLRAAAWTDLARGAGSTEAEMRALGDLLGRARTAVLVWSMGVTQHANGEDNVRAIVNLALARGFVGRDKCGLMPIRGHSGVQGGAEMGCYTDVLPGALALSDETAEHFGALWGFPVPRAPGRTAAEMLDAAYDGRLDVLVCAGGNFLDVLPDPRRVETALGRIPLRVHLDLVLSPQMLVDPPAGGAVLLLPAATRYEIAGGVTETSTERRVIFSPEVPGPRIEDARAEWWVFGELAARVRPDLAGRVRFAGTPEIRAEIAAAVPAYRGIETLRAYGDAFQYGGRHLCGGWRFPTPDGRAHFTRPAIVAATVPAGHVRVTTRRGKQFNSMVHENRDMLTGAGRDDVLMAAADVEQFALADGGPVVLRSATGTYRGRVLVAPVAPGSAHVHWPEGNVLVAAGTRSPQARVPDYTALCTVAAS